MLTNTEVKQLNQKSKQYKVFDGGGMYLLVTPSGSKRWLMKYRFLGVEKTLSFGTYPMVSLKDAREKRHAAKVLLQSSVDPGEQKKVEKSKAIAKRENNFSACAEAWYTHKSASWASASATKARTYLDSDLIPALGKRPMTDIRRPELVEVLASIEGRGAVNVAKKCRGWLSGIFKHSMALGVIDANPSTDLSIVAARPPKTRHHPHLPIEELPELLDALPGFRGAPETRLAIELLLFTAVRPGELRHARWEEFDTEAAVWAIPAERMKMRRPHVVPLPSQALATLRELHKFTGHRELAFASPYKPKQPMSANTINSALEAMGFKNRQTGHGFRHLISTALNNKGHNSDWIEVQLAHGDADTVRGTYNKALYLDQRRTMMQDWADQLDTLRK